MVLKGLALGAAVATVAVAIFVALTFQPGGARVAAPASGAVVLLNGVAVPQLQPAQAGAPALVEAAPGSAGEVRAKFDRAASGALSLRAELTAPTTSSATEAYAVLGCGGK